MIQHIVCLALPEGWDQGELLRIMSGLAALTGEVEGFVAFQHGPNIDLEEKSAGFPYMFVGRFTDQAALERYASDPRHRTLGAALVRLCGGAERIVVYDMDCAEQAG